MTGEAFDAAARALPGVTLEILWGADHVYKVGGRMFAATGPSRTSFSCKMSDIAFEALTETGRARPAPYAARHKWVLFDDLSVLDAEEVTGWLRNAHALVAARLTQKARRALGLA